MERIEDTGLESDLPVGQIRATLDDAPVRVAILFGSHAAGRAHDQSDVDLAVEFDGLEPGDSEYNETRFGLSTDLCEALGTDDVDLVDVHSLPPSLARSVFDHGILLIGSGDRIAVLRERLLDEGSDERSPRERFDSALRRIDEHLA
ncbi:type VII toxin-antitoxin system MntA family adenylyltransferase antitoxin [Halosimplex marinum]|uniref:type VII toxin-antitoxin system MntA family adenylyltransferase antitoxin n=1 Tax=Halosimplex marinum TaxID=3396620 RepID=UPI003F551900